MKKQIIAISRQCGSGGYTIGQELAQRLGVPFYDKEYLDTHAHPDENHVQSCTSLLFCLTTGMYDGYLLSKAGGTEDTEREAALIRRLADQGPCVFVGRCAEYVLRDREDCLHVFVHADMEHRAERIVRLYGETKQSPQKRLAEKDNKRKVYYRHYTNRNWGEAQNYHLCLNSGRVGVEKCVDIIVDVAKLYE